MKNKMAEPNVKQKTHIQAMCEFPTNKGSYIFTNSKGKTITLQQNRLLPCNIKQVIDLQNQVNGEIDNVDIFKDSSEEEIFESMLLDYCYGLFDDKKLVAICIGVMNRESPRNLCKLVGDLNFKNYATFDSVQVHKDYRGYGIQQFFLIDFEKHIKNLFEVNAIDNIKILATVSPKNLYSLNNFLKAGYSHGDIVSAYGSQRYVVQKSL